MTQEQLVNQIRLLKQELDIIKTDVKGMVKQIGSRIGEHEQFFSQLIKAMEAFDARLEKLEPPKPEKEGE